MDADLARALLREWANGSQEAGELLVRRISPEIWSASHRLLNDAAEAEDVTQETFLKLWQNRERWQELDDLRPWLRRIAANASINILRKRVRQKLLEQVSANGEEPPPVLARVQLEDASRAIDSLSDTYKLPFVYRYLLGLSNEEAAEKLGLTPEAFRVRIHRALVSLRSILKGAK